MDKKIKHRILGILVIAGLVVLTLPLFQGEKESPKTTLLVQAPPFPSQSLQATDNTISDTSLEVTNEKETSTQPIPSPQPNKQPSQPMLSTSEKIISSDPVVTENLEKKIISPTQKKIAQPKHIKKAVTLQQSFKLNKRKTTHLSSKKHASFQHEIIRNNELASLNQAAWIVQLGSFKNKTNALRLVNQLRLKGYRAFIQQVSTSLGESTRVFVGPQNKQQEAFALANQLENETHIQGVVISYKPLAL